MLVDMGDLPRPDQGVLSETLWQAKATTSSVTNKPDFPMKPPGKPEMIGISSTNGTTKIDKIVDKSGKFDYFFMPFHYIILLVLLI